MDQSGSKEATARRRPRQTRSIEKVERILGSARKLISQVSIEQFTTDLIAEHAGVAVGTIYQYFPNKIEILRAVIDQYLEGVRKDLTDFEDSIKSEDMEHALNRMNDAIYKDWTISKKSIIFSLSISKYCSIYPELEAIDREHGKAVALTLTKIIRKLGSNAPENELLMAGRHLYSMHNMLEQMMIEGGDPQLLIKTHSELTRRMIRMMVSL